MKNKRRVPSTLEVFAYKQFEDAAKLNLMELLILTIISMGLTGIMGWLFVEVWNMERLSKTVSGGVLAFYALTGTAGVPVFLGCVGGFWFKLKG